MATSSSQRWYRRLAKSQFVQGKWSSQETSLLSPDDPFQLLLDDLAIAVGEYNRHASVPITLLQGANNSDSLATLVFKAVQLRFHRKDKNLDILLMRVQNFMSETTPLMRITSVQDSVGSMTWIRGTVEYSCDQIIKNSLLHLIEASARDSDLILKSGV